MSLNTKKQFKQFELNNIQDACLALGMLISGLMIHLEKYKEYSNEAEILLKNLNTEYILAKDYDNINDKLLYRQHEILSLSADHQSSSFSYISLRKILLKRGYLKTSLSDEMTMTLNELLDVRNWTFHTPQSLLVATKKAAEKNIPMELKEIVQVNPQLNPVIVVKVEKYEALMLVSLTMHTKKRIDQFESIINSMRADYQEMYDSIDNKPLLMTNYGLSSEVQYVDKHIISRITGYQSDISQISMAIQKSKYDGSNQAFEDWVIRVENNSVNKKSEESQ